MFDPSQIVVAVITIVGSWWLTRHKESRADAMAQVAKNEERFEKIERELKECEASRTRSEGTFAQERYAWAVERTSMASTITNLQRELRDYERYARYEPRKGGARSGDLPPDDDT